MRTPRAFTLIELLVVISIIALLSSVVLASLNAAREKARIAATRQFASQAYRVGGELAVGVWDFDECSGTAAGDRSGFGNAGAFTGMTGSEWSSDTPSGTGCSLLLDGSNDVLTVPDSSSLDVTGQVSLSIWLKSTGTNAFSGLIYKTSGNTGYQFGIGATTGIRGDLYNGTTYISPGHSANVLDGKWHNVILSYDGAAARIFVDGVSGNAVTGAGFLTTNSAPLYIGNDACCGGRFFNGRLDEPRVYNKAVTVAEAERIYAEGMRKRRVAGDI